MCRMRGWTTKEDTMQTVILTLVACIFACALVGCSSTPELVEEPTPTTEYSCSDAFGEFQQELQKFMDGGTSTAAVLTASDMETYGCPVPEGYISWDEVRQDIGTVRSTR